MKRIRRIMHATDFSPVSRAAFARAMDLARTSRAELTLVHVYSAVVPYMGESYALPQVYTQMLASVRADAQRHLDRLLARAKRAGVRGRTLLLEGIPHDRIVRAARARRADLLVIGTHGRTGLAGMLLGSVAARVIALAPCPVLTVRGRSRAR
jgi:nucleotide-binding universal stress UspA family protein